MAVDVQVVDRDGRPIPDLGPDKFDVLIDGASSSCSGLSATVVPPMTGFSMMDAANEGYGGRVEFSDLAMY